MEKSTLDQLRIERQPEKEPSGYGKILVAIIGVLLVLAAGYYFWAGPVASMEVRTVIARELKSEGASTVLNASGYVTARRQATVSSKFTGKVIEVNIEEGMRVEQGQILARLDDSNIRTSFNLADAQWVSAQRGLDETDALLKEARLNFDRISRLVEKDLASEAELDRSRALAESLDAQLKRKVADVEVAARQLDIYRPQLEDTIIRAPFPGVVVAKNAQPGEMISPVSAGGGFTRTGIGTIVDMASLEIEIDVNEAYINRVIAGQSVVATLDAYPDWKIPCHVIAIIPTADRQRATVEVRVGFDQAGSAHSARHGRQGGLPGRATAAEATAGFEAAGSADPPARTGTGVGLRGERGQGGTARGGVGETAGSDDTWSAGSEPESGWWSTGRRNWRTAMRVEETNK